MASDPFAAARAQVARAEKMLNQKRGRDYRVTSDVVDAVFGNLGQTMRSTNKGLTSGSARILKQMMALRDSQAGDAALIGAMGDRAGQAGGMGGYADQAFDPANARAVGAVGIGNADVQAGKDYLGTAQGLVKMSQAGARQAEAGAQYETAQALAARTKADVGTIAAQQHDIAMAEIQSQHDMEMAFLQHKLELDSLQKQYDMAQSQQKRAESVVNAKLGPQAVSTSRILAGAVNEARSLLSQDHGMTDQELVDAVAKAIGEENDPNLKVMLPRLIYFLRSGNTGLSAINSVMREFYASQWQDFGKQWSSAAQHALSVQDYNKQLQSKQSEGPSFWNDVASFLTPWNRG
jgi:hypothetical protein